MDGQGRKVKDGEGGFFHCGFALDCVTRSGVGRSTAAGSYSPAGSEKDNILRISRNI